MSQGHLMSREEPVFAKQVANPLRQTSSHAMSNLHRINK
jgi:hypothetical protein